MEVAPGEYPGAPPTGAQQPYAVLPNTRVGRGARARPALEGVEESMVPQQGEEHA